MTPTVPAPAGAAWAMLLERTLAMCAVGIVVAAVGMSLAAATGDAWARRNAGLWSLLAMQAILIGLFAWSAFRRPGIIVTLAAVAAGLLGIVAASWLVRSDVPVVAEPTAGLLPLNAVQAAQLVAVFFIRRSLAAASVILVAAAGWIWLAPEIASRNAVVDELLMPTAFSLSALVLVHALRAAAGDADLADHQQQQSRAEVAAVARATIAEEEGRRVVHDRVIGALALVSAASDASAAHEACELALASLKDIDPATSAEALQSALAAKKGIRVLILDGAWRYAPPSQVITALRESAGEAIRNARRHSGVDEVTVQLVSNRVGQVGVRVRDEGRGFRSDEVGAGFGLARSVAARMHEVGGVGVVTSAPGTGTTVDLSWPMKPTPKGRHASGIFVRPERSNVYLRAIAPVVAAQLYLAGRYPSWPSHLWWSLALALALSAVVLACAWAVGRTRPTWWLVSSVAVLIVVVLWLTFPASVLHGLLSLHSWPVFAAGSIAGLLALEATWRQLAVLATTAFGTVVVYTGRDAQLGFLEPFNALAVPSVFVFAAFSIGALLRRGAAMISVQQSVDAMQADEQAWLESSRASRRRIAEQLRSDVGPFLELFAAGHAEFTTELRQRATALAAQCRDLISHDDAIPAEVRAAILAARARGMTVNVRLGGQATAGMWMLLQAVLRRVPHADAVTIVPTSTRDSARVTVLPRLRAREAETVRLDLMGANIALESTLVSTTFVLSPKWATSVEAPQRLGSTP